MTLTRQLRLPNLERWYMYPGAVYEDEVYADTSLEVFIWGEDGEIYILTITDVPEEVLYSNEELITDIESLAHHLVIEKGSTQLYEFYQIDKSGFKPDPDSEDSVQTQWKQYKSEVEWKYLEKYIYPKYPLEGHDHHQQTFQY